MTDRASISSLLKRTMLAATSTLILICSSCSLIPTQQAVELTPRTYYESLDLSSPESAIQTFVDAFSRDDFPTVWLILGTQAQFIWVQGIQLLRFDALIQTDNWEAIQMDISTYAKGLGEGEHSDSEPSYVFDQFMLAARKHSAFLIDLTGPVEILSSEPSSTTRDDPAIDVTVRVERIEEEVVFRMVQAPSGRWRVYQVILTGGDVEMVPWAIPKEPEPIRIEASAAIQVPCTGDPPPPSQATPGQPYLIAEPTCGDLSTLEDNSTVPGTMLTLTGSGFEPNTETVIWWEDPLGNSFRIRQEGEYLTATTDDEGSFLIDIVMPYRLMPSSAGEGPHLHRILAVQEIPADGP